MQLNIIENQPLDGMTTLGLRSLADYFVRVETTEELKAALDWADKRGISVGLLGAGANTVARSHIEGLVIAVAIKGYALEKRPDGTFDVTVGAGETFDDIVRRTVEEGRGGLENLAAIPGTVGGAVVQNIGAYGVELAERLVGVSVWDRASRSERKLTMSDCDFKYRHSLFKTPEGRNLVVLSATLRLPKVWTPVLGYKDLSSELLSSGLLPQEVSPADVERAVRAVRARKLPDPKEIGNAGSFFTNPIVTHVFWRDLLTRHPNLVYYRMGGGRMKLAAGWMIEALGFKGTTVGNVGIYDKHALILVNRGGATGEEVLAFSDAVIEKVKKEFGVTLEREPVIL